MLCRWIAGAASEEHERNEAVSNGHLRKECSFAKNDLYQSRYQVWLCSLSLEEESEITGADGEEEEELQRDI